MVMSAAKKHKRVVLSLEQKIEVDIANNCSISLNTNMGLSVTALAHTPHPETPQEQVFSAAWKHDALLSNLSLRDRLPRVCIWDVRRSNET